MRGHTRKPIQRCAGIYPQACASMCIHAHKHVHMCAGGVLNKRAIGPVVRPRPTDARATFDMPTHKPTHLHIASFCRPTVHTGCPWRPALCTPGCPRQPAGAHGHLRCQPYRPRQGYDVLLLGRVPYRQGFIVPCLICACLPCPRSLRCSHLPAHARRPP